MLVRMAVRLYAVPSTSMEPALLAGDRIVVTPLFTDTPARGDVIVFLHPADGTMTVKRVIATPGDLIDTENGRLRIGGKVIPEPYVRAPVPITIAAQVVPSRHLFVMGDNRADSYDSRHWGPLPDHLVVGRARLVLGRFKWIE